MLKIIILIDHQQLNLEIVNLYEDKFEIDCIFNKKGKYKVEFYANDDGTNYMNGTMNYIIKFKIKSELETIIIIDKQWHYLNKNEQ